MIGGIIDYRKIADAIDFYQGLGYKYIEVPWIVSRDSMEITRPKGNFNYFNTFMGDLVASGEQSFLEIRDKLEPNGKYMCVTPCFRDEQIDELHKNYFVKVELIVANPDDYNDGSIIGEDSHSIMLYDAMRFFQRYSYNISFCTHGKWPDLEVDINVNDIEVGSYGWRQYNGFRWHYGTGCAEPRLSQALRSGIC